MPPSVSVETRQEVSMFEEDVSQAEAKCEVKSESGDESDDDERKDKSKQKKKVKKNKKERKRSSKKSSSSSDSETETDSDESSSDESEKKKKKKRKSKQKTVSKKKTKKNKKRKISESSDEESDDSDDKRKKKGKNKKSLNKKKMKKEKNKESSSSEDGKHHNKRQKKKKVKRSRHSSSSSSSTDDDSDDEKPKKVEKSKGGKGSNKPANKKVKIDKFWTSSSEQSSGDEKENGRKKNASKKSTKKSTKGKTVSSTETELKEKKTPPKGQLPNKNMKFAATEFYQLGATGKKGFSPIVTTERIARLTVNNLNKTIPEPIKRESASPRENGVQESPLPIKPLPQGFVKACEMQRPIFRVPAKVSFLKPVSRTRVAAPVNPVNPVKPQTASLPANHVVKPHINPSVAASRSITAASILPKYAQKISAPTESQNIGPEKPKNISPVVSPPNESKCVDLESDSVIHKTEVVRHLQVQIPSVQNSSSIVVQNHEPSSPSSHFNLDLLETFVESETLTSNESVPG